MPASALPQRRILVPTAEKSPVPWRYTLEKLANDWFQPAFNDGNWKQGATPFGTKEPEFGRKPNTVWTSADIWLRREFQMPDGCYTDMGLLMHHDEDTEVYINGVLAAKTSGYNASYEPFDLAPEAQMALQAGKNTLAVHCHQTVGGQYMDIGIDGVIPQTIYGKASIGDSTYRGWKALTSGNGLIEIHVVPDVGGRVIQFRLGKKDFLWVNPNLHGKTSPQTGLAPDGSWLNYGGDKIWPAPQGWDNDQQWPGPPDAVLDGQPYTLEKLRANQAGQPYASPAARIGAAASNCRGLCVFSTAARA